MSESIVLFNCFYWILVKLNIPIIAGNWQEVLREHVDPEQLPVVYGGTLTDPDGDPRCRTMVKAQSVLVDQNPIIGLQNSKKKC